MNRIRVLRLEHGMKQPDLAEKLNCTAMTVSRYERGEADPDVATICRLCEIFGCTADYLLGRSPVPTTDLSPEEESLLLAYRRSDDRARDMVAVALAPFAEESSESSAI